MTRRQISFSDLETYLHESFELGFHWRHTSGFLLEISYGRMSVARWWGDVVFFEIRICSQGMGYHWLIVWHVTFESVLVIPLSSPSTLSSISSIMASHFSYHLSLQNQVTSKYRDISFHNPTAMVISSRQVENGSQIVCPSKRLLQTQRLDTSHWPQPRCGYHVPTSHMGSRTRTCTEHDWAYWKRKLKLVLVHVFSFVCSILIFSFFC